MGLRLLKDSTTEPVGSTDLRAHLRVDSTAEVALIDGLEQSARTFAERWTRRSFVNQDWRLTMDRRPVGDVVTLPRSPLSSSAPGVTVEFLKRADAGTTNYTTFDSTNYIVDFESEPGRVVLKDDETWPEDELANANAFRVDFTAGYGGSSQVPTPLKQAVKLIVGHHYENRETVIVGSIATRLPLAAESLLWNYRVPEVP